MDNKSSKHPMKVGFYGDDLKSKQAVPCGAGDTPNYAKAGLNRAWEHREMYGNHWDNPRHQMAHQEMFQGGYTFKMGREKDGPKE